MINILKTLLFFWLCSFLLFTSSCKPSNNSKKLKDVCETRQELDCRVYPEIGPFEKSFYLNDSAYSIGRDSWMMKPILFYTDFSILGNNEATYEIEYEGQTYRDSVFFKHKGPGYYTFLVKPQNCKQTLYVDNKEFTCSCKLKSEKGYPVTIEIVDTVRIVIKKLQYIPKKKLGCTYDFPANPCPDLSPTFRDNIGGAISLGVLWDFDNSKEDTATWVNSREMTINKKYTSMKLSITEYDKLADDDVLFSTLISNESVNNWSTGKYILAEGEIILEIVRL